MKLRMIGCSHHDTPLEIREQVAFSSEQITQALWSLKEQFPDTEAVLLNTCNRVELYWGASHEDKIATQEAIERFLSEFHRVGLRTIQEHFKVRHDGQAVEHLFTVVSSIDSLVVGESQIPAQVRSAYDRSKLEGAAGAVMHSLFQHANQVSKRVTTETEIHRRRISVPSVAVSEVASEFYERFDDKNIVVIGSGQMGVETLQYLLDAGARNIVIVNRSLDKAQSVADQMSAAAQFELRAEPWDALDRLLAWADLVVSTTGAAEPIVTESRLKPILAKRTRPNLLILDLAVPRDFEPAIARLPSVYLYSVDDLQSVCQRNEAFRKQQLPKARKIIDEEVQKILADWNLRQSGDTIRALRDQADLIRDSELLRLFSKQSMQELNAEAHQEILQAVDRVINKLLHGPLQSLREAPHEDHRESLATAIRRLFKLG
ncbi:MAG: glutamyl-tRNA reductase [Planctomycetota bacterium]|jgi:glutamyl-tRNA reductase|nr:glutamyl-tRNA reductase [Planctomycetota bacterium]RLS68079.1 MAG: glutamyl-tRNA reductase [Planctomycetota bacterium]RLS98940.1 MAG: glutamyl-tRNA reductase [Planctomycetota bacterium]